MYRNGAVGTKSISPGVIGIPAGAPTANR